MKKKLKIALFCTTIISTNSLALENIKITKIDVKNLKELTKEYVIEKIPVKVGDNYTNKELSDIYVSLRSTGVFTNVNIYPTFNSDNKEVSLLLEVDEVANAKEELANRQAYINASKRTELLVNSLVVTGNDNVDVSEIISHSNIKIGDYFTPITVNELANAIASSGYFQNVTPEVTRNANGKSVDIKLTLLENPKLRSITIKGVKVFTTEQIKEVAGLKEGQVINANAFNPNISPILGLYQEVGVITARIIDVKFKNGDILLEISEGEIDKVKFEKTSQKQDNKRLSEKQFRLKTKLHVLERMNYLKEGDILTKQGLTNTIQEFYKTGLFSSVEPKITGNEKDVNGRNVTFIVEERPTTSINANVAYESKEGFTGGITLADKNFLGNQQELSLQTNFGTRGNYDLGVSFFDPWIKGTKKLQVGTNVFFKREKAKKSDLDKDGEMPKELENFKRISGSYIYGASVTLGKGVARNTFITVRPRIYGVRSTNATDTPTVLVDYTLSSISGTLIYDSRNDSYLPTQGFYLSAGYEAGYIFRENSMKPSILNKVQEEFKKNSNGESLEKKWKDYKKEEEKNMAQNSGQKKDDKNNDKKKQYEEKLKSVKEELQKTFSSNNDKLPTRPFHILNVDFRAYHRVYKDTNSMAYRLTLGYANEGTPENLMFRVNDGTTLRGYNDEPTNAIFTATAENRTYVNKYIQLIAFGELGINSKQINGNTNGVQKYTEFKYIFNKDNLKIDIGIGARVTTPIGIMRFDYAWPLMPKPKKGKFSFGFGQTF